MSGMAQAACGLIAIVMLLTAANTTQIDDSDESPTDTFADVTQKEDSGRGSSQPHIWKNNNVKVLRISSSDICNNELQMQRAGCQFFRGFFDGCTSPLDFYTRVNTSTEDAQIIPDFFICFSLDKLVKRYAAGDTKLWCTQQAMLLAAGIKATFSHWDPDLNRYVLNEDVGGFVIQFWESCDEMIFPYFPLHSQIVIDKWNGDESPLGYEELEIDTWSNYIGPWECQDHRNCGITSILYTTPLGT